MDKVKKVTKYPNGKVESECYYADGDLHGPSRFYSDSGVCLSESTFVRNKREGEFIRYYLSGNLSSIERYKEGSLEGKQEFYYEDRSLKTELHYLGWKCITIQILPFFLIPPTQ